NTATEEIIGHERQEAAKLDRAAAIFPIRHRVDQVQPGSVKRRDGLALVLDLAAHSFAEPANTGRLELNHAIIVGVGQGHLIGNRAGERRDHWQDENGSQASREQAEWGFGHGLKSSSNGMGTLHVEKLFSSKAKWSFPCP